MQVTDNHEPFYQGIREFRRVVNPSSKKTKRLDKLLVCRYPRSQCSTRESQRVTDQRIRANVCVIEISQTMIQEWKHLTRTFHFFR